MQDSRFGTQTSTDFDHQRLNAIGKDCPASLADGIFTSQKANFTRGRRLAVPRFSRLRLSLRLQ